MDLPALAPSDAVLMSDTSMQVMLYACAADTSSVWHRRRSSTSDNFCLQLSDGNVRCTRKPRLTDILHHAEHIHLPASATKPARPHLRWIPHAVRHLLLMPAHPAHLGCIDDSCLCARSTCRRAYELAFSTCYMFSGVRPVFLEVRGMVRWERILSSEQHACNLQMHIVIHLAGRRRDHS
jgi:hypothetical protein